MVRLLLQSLVLVALSITLISCSDDDPTPVTAPHTGDPQTEETEINPSHPTPSPESDQFSENTTDGSDDINLDVDRQGQISSEVDSGGNPIQLSKIYYIYASKLNVRSGPNTSHPSLGMLNLNDQIEVVSLQTSADGRYDFIEIEILKTNSKIKASQTYYVPIQYLSDEPQELRKQKLTQYFMIQNIASEKLRVYERGCESGNCPHRLILEADMAVGEDEEGRRTAAGHFRLSSWTKFYQDNAGLYPSWYDPSYPEIPDPGASVFSWAKNKVLPYKEAAVRGAFGWYTAKVSPNSHHQWTHGTIGWGQDKKKYIKVTRKFFANLFKDPRSHGCSRTDNETIAYVREVLPAGSTVIKVYAQEAMAHRTPYQYYEQPQTWEYILTKNGVRQDGQKADRNKVLSAGTPKDQWLEVGAYQVDQHPDAKYFRGGKRGKRKNKNGNVYGLDEQQMQGVFLVNEGRLVNYQHPQSEKILIGGYSDQKYPHFIVSDTQDYWLPKK